MKDLSIRQLLLLDHLEHRAEIEKAINDGEIRLVRHVMRNTAGWHGFDEQLRFDKELLKVFTAEQGRPIFKEGQLLLVFVAGGGGSGALLRGAFKCAGRLTKEQFEKQYGTACPQYWSFLGERRPPDAEGSAVDGFYYDLLDTEVLADLWDRLVIDWGLATVAWVQRSLDKAIREIKPKGFVCQFPNWDEVFITHQELQAIIENPKANDDWFHFLSKHDGVYTILDTQSNSLYVGSAYGSQGLWGRWSGYARTGHNDNKGLLNLFRNECGAVNVQSRASYFRFSINHVFAKGTKTPTQVIKYETLAKRKVGSSLNHN